MVSVSMRELLEAGVHFGHQVRKWNPKMKPYIYGKKNGIYIIDLQTSIEMFRKALTFVTDTAAEGKEVLIVGTKKQAQTIIAEVAEECGLHYVNKRWLGGLLTNFSMIKKSIEKLLDLDEMKRDGRWEVKSKKEQSKMDKIYKKLHKNLWGMRKLNEIPGAIIIIDSNFEDIAVYEAKKLEIPIVGIVDTNADPDGIAYPVPGNDDAIRSIKLFASKFGEAVKIGIEKKLAASLEQEEEVTEDVEASAEDSTEEKAAEQIVEKTKEKEVEVAAEDSAKKEIVEQTVQKTKKKEVKVVAEDSAKKETVKQKVEKTKKKEVEVATEDSAKKETAEQTVEKTEDKIIEKEKTEEE